MMPKIQFSQLFDEAIQLWPDTIFVGNGKIMEDNGGVFPELSKAWRKVEQKIEVPSKLDKLMSWSIYNGLHKLARESLLTGAEYIYISKIDTPYVESRFADSLFYPDNDEYYREIRNQYVRDI